jgi:hypothetical protein
MNNKIKNILTVLLAIGIAWQSYKIYQLEKEYQRLEKSGQLKCKIK